MLQRILLIDDSEGEALLVKQRLRYAGLEDPLYHIQDAEEALAYLQGVDRFADRKRFPIPEIVLLDLGMPKVDGFQILRWIRQQPHLARMLVVVLTGEVNPKHIALAYQLGANSYLAKAGSDEEYGNFVRFFKSYAFISPCIPSMVEDRLPMIEAPQSQPAADSADNVPCKESAA